MGASSLDVPVSPAAHSLKSHGNRYPWGREGSRGGAVCVYRPEPASLCVPLNRKVAVRATGCPRGASRQYPLRCALGVPEAQEGP